jgi:hypothetical protein
MDFGFLICAMRHALRAMPIFTKKRKGGNYEKGFGFGILFCMYG